MKYTIKKIQVDEKVSKKLSSSTPLGPKQDGLIDWTKGNFSEVSTIEVKSNISRGILSLNNENSVPKQKNGGRLISKKQSEGITFSQSNNSKLLPIIRIPYRNLKSSEVAIPINGESDKPVYTIPSFKYRKFLNNPVNEFEKTREIIHGSLKTWQETDKWEQDVRYPYVEKGLPISIKTREENIIPKSQTGSKLERLKRQAFAESGWNPNAVSPRGASGPLQIMPDAYKDYQSATGDNTPYEQVKNFPQAIKVRNWLVNNISDSDFIKGKPQDEDVRLAKVYGSYNWGKTNMANYLNNAKAKGIDIYKSNKWTEGLPEETRGYIEKILSNKNLQFEKDYQNTLKTNNNKIYFK